MERIKLKLSMSRKSLHNLSVRQRSRVMFEIKNRLRYRSKYNIADENNRDVQNISIPLVTEYGLFTNNNDTCNYKCNATSEDDGSFVSCSSSFSSIFDESDAVVSSFIDTSIEPSFRERLASCFVDNNLTHIQGNSILSLLRTHPCFSTLPKDVRTLLDTPHTRVVVADVEPGEYVHFDLEAGIIQHLSDISIASIVNYLELDFNIDGCTLDKSGCIQIWPIQCRIVNVQCARPIVVGVYKGAHKPHDPNIFLKEFISDITRIMSNGGINFRGNKVPIRLRCFIADAPARAFILNHRSHVSSHPCSKCKVSGIRCEGRNIFNGTSHSLRTDEEYVRCVDEDHHKEGNCPLSMLPMGIVLQTPFKYMHLVCLGVMKKILSAWIYGKYSRLSKLSGRFISIMCARLNNLKEYCPSDFARRPRSLEMCSKYKATEFRQFLLYTGPVVTYGVLDERLYKHFLFLHVAIRILVSNSSSRQYLNFAELALQKFVHRSDSFYGPTFNTYNIHGLLHLTNDVRRFGTLDSFSAFPYENNMSIFRKYCRKPGLPLQQFFKRMTEIKIHGTVDTRVIDSSIRVSALYNDSNCHQYRKTKFNGILLSIDVRDSCCILRNGSICIVCNISLHNNLYRLAVKKFLQVEDFYDIDVLSSALQIYKCSTLSNEIFYINLDEVHAKCYRMPFWNSTSMDDSDSNEDHLPQYIVAAIVHSEKTKWRDDRSAALRNLPAIRPLPPMTNYQNARRSH
ncbi:uncharacterized protein [Linepithema humile]|uniref:uncharacterized protein n=1 Tax=Linepithema humile TaxID=83485 RepID=UPI00351DE2A9